MNKSQEDTESNILIDKRNNIKATESPKTRNNTLIKTVKIPSVENQFKKIKGISSQNKLKKNNDGYKTRTTKNCSTDENIKNVLVNCRQPSKDLNLQFKNNIEENKQKFSIDQDENITQISQFVEKEKFFVHPNEPGVTFNEIAEDEEIFLFDIPKDVFDKNLIGEKMIFSPTSLTLGNNVYPVSETSISSKFLCTYDKNVNGQNLYSIKSIDTTELFLSAPTSDSILTKYLTLSESDEKQIISSNDNFRNYEAVNANSGVKLQQKKTNISLKKKIDRAIIKTSNKKISLKRAREDDYSKLPLINQSSKKISKFNIGKVDDNSNSNNANNCKIVQTVKKENKRLKNDQKINIENKFADKTKKNKLTKSKELNNKKTISAATAAEEIKNIIGKVFKINENNLNSDNSFNDGRLTYETLNCNRINDNLKRYLSTSSSDEEAMIFNTSFKVEETKKKEAPR